MVSKDIEGRITKKMCFSCNREFTGIVSACPHDGTTLVALEQDQLIGTRLMERYEILSVIGHGGMGIVYKARHELMDRIVAIKMLQRALISDSMSVKRFQREARAASRLKHPNVITLFDFGVSPTGQPFLVMDYLEGESLADIIKRDGQVGVDRCVQIIRQTCNALDHAHGQRIVHRDMKPGNIMLLKNSDGKDIVKVVDFGVAQVLEEDAQRLTQTGEVCGSPVYMSPEQCMGMKLDARSDIYSTGIVMYESLTGRLPLLGKTMIDTMSKHISDMPPVFSDVRPDLYIPERLEAVIFKALSKNPEERYQSMAELEQDITLAIPRPGQNPALRATIAFEPPGAKLAPLNLIIAGLGALIVVLAGILIWMGVSGLLPWQRHAAPSAAPESQPGVSPTQEAAVTKTAVPRKPEATKGTSRATSSPARTSPATGSPAEPTGMDGADSTVSVDEPVRIEGKPVDSMDYWMKFQHQEKQALPKPKPQAKPKPHAQPAPRQSAPIKEKDPWKQIDESRSESYRRYLQ